MRGIHVYERRRLPRLTRLGRALALAVVVLLLAAGVGLGLARAEDEDVPRFQPATRGPRASYGTAAVERWRGLVEAYPWPAETALLVIACESQGDPDAVNPWSGAAGLMQLYGWSWLARRLFGTGDVLIPWVNVGVAFALWEDSGGTFRWHWAASRGCWG